MEYCSFNLPDLPNVSLVEKLQDTYKNDYARLSATITAIMNDNGDDFNSDFSEFYKIMNNSKEAPNFQTESNDELKKIADTAIQYINKIDPRISNRPIASNDQSVLASYNYSEIAAREEGEKHVSRIILDTFKKVKFDGIDIKGNKINYYLGAVRNTINGYIFKQVGKTPAEISKFKKEYKALETRTERRDYINKLLRDKSKTLIGQNLFALWCEFNLDNKHAVDYLNDLFNDPLLNKVLDDTSRDLDELNDENNAESNPEANEVEDTTDVEGALADNKQGVAIYDDSGLKKDFVKHLSDVVRIYFDTLPVLTSTDIDSYDRNNFFGIPTRMNAKECGQFLWGINEDFDNIDSMIDAIEQSSRRVAKFRSFAILARDLRANPSLAKEIFTTFAKPKYTKIELDVTDETTTVKVANPRVNREAAMLFDFMNNIKSSININDHEIMDKKYKELSSIMTDFATQKRNAANENLSQSRREEAKAKLDDIKEQAIVKITSILKSYFPKIEESAVRAYIELNNDAGNNTDALYANCVNLATDIKGIVQEHENCKKGFDIMQANLNRVRTHNAKLDMQKRRGNWVSKSQYLSEAEYKNDNYISPEIPFIKSLVSKLKLYSVGNISLNERNINGNLQSSILNSNWLSGIKHMMDKFTTEYDEKGNPVLKNDTLVQWGIRKLINTKVNNAASILVEQKDENNVVLNPDKAIFRIVNGTVQLTENADKILKIMFFQGSSNLTDGVNLDYSKMNNGDFFPTMYMMFFNTKKDGGVELATYFPKTPSDAPNTFGIQSVRLNTEGLYTMTEKERERVDTDIRQIINDTTPIIPRTDFVNDYMNHLSDEDINNKKTPLVVIEDSELRDYLTSSKDRHIPNDYAIRRTSPVKEGESSGYVTYITKSGISFVLEGTIYKGQTGSFRIKNSKLVGVVGHNAIKKTDFDVAPQEIHDALYDKYFNILDKRNITIGETTFNKINYTINTNHPVYKLVRNQFKQEVLDGAIAISHYFNLKRLDNGNYVVAFDGKLPSIKGDITRGYDNYHKKGGKVINISKSGTSFHLTGDVFHFSNFTLNVQDEHGNTYTKNYFEHLISESLISDESGTINFLYGGGLEFVCDDNGKVVDVVFPNDDVKNNIDAAMSEYLKDYIEEQSQLVSKHKRSIKHTSVNREHIVEFAVNNLLMQFNFDCIFDGSTKLYKSNQDVIKRMKALQASGNPYGNSDYSADFVPNVNEATHSFLNEGFINEAQIKRVKTKEGKIVIRPVLDEKGKPIINKKFIRDIFDNDPVLKGTRERNGFYAVTIENSKRTNEKALQELKKVLVERCKLEPDKADEILYGELEENEKGELVRTKGYQGTKVNDAQSYITIQEFVRRLSAKGQLKRYLPLIEKIMDESKPISAKDIIEFVQVQKNVYYDLYLDTNYGIEVPRFIKNAEFVLIPRFIKGTQLEAVYKAMREAGIDQLNTRETSKAANEKVLRLWDNDANIDDNVLNTFIAEASANKQIFTYNNLYTQQETPQHMDAMNKAGIQVMKKMLDNIPEKGHPLSGLKRQFFKVYSRNIEEGCLELLKKLEIPTDENGKLLLDDNNNIIGLNQKVLYERMLEEARRLGVDENQKDYFTFLEDSSFPLMPSFVNSYLTRFESVYQSMFNSAVTRQKLPGFHAVQVTNVGFKPYGEQPTNVSYSKELEYHPNGEPYIQVIVPYKALGIDKNSDHYKNMDDEAILEELEKKGLLDFIGYRIPTEGKQSVAIMRVAGFIDDAYGSTIIVPDDWVSQTGSDFDIDSVYTILHEHYTTSTGEIGKIEYKANSNNKPRNVYDWFRYLRTHKTNESYNTSTEIKKRNKAFAEEQRKEITKLKEIESEKYNNLPDDVKEDIKALHRYIKKLQQDLDLNDYEAYVDQLTRVYGALKNNENLEKIPELKEFVEATKNIKEALENKYDNYSEAYKKHVDEVLAERLDFYNKLAKDNGLLTLDEYLKDENDNIANDRKARNSRILDIFLDILRDDSSLEENLSRSNFDKISEKKKAKMNKNLLKERAGRNPHNIGDQVKYQEEVISGRALKGMSVALDTMCSVCNTVRPTLEQPITVVYSKDEIDANNAKKSFKVDNETETSFSVTHNTYGWSENNRNIAGYILTVYSSQTTAYILDAVKEGSIPNLNLYTFGVFKTLANIGIDYGTILSFIMQPGVSRIVDFHNAKNSVFNRGYGNEINDAIESICKRLLPEADKNSSISTLLKIINEKYADKINSLFKVGDKDVKFGTTNAAIANIPIIGSVLDERLQGTGRFTDIYSEDALLVDLATALIYMRLHRITSAIGNIARCCNPDKFGAKATVYDTRKTFDNIDKCIFTTENWFDEDIENIEDLKPTKKQRKHILSVDGKHILEAIYPGVANPYATKDQIINNIIKNGDINESKYPPLFAFLKYSTATSSLIARTIFETQDPVFTFIVEGIGQTFSGASKEVSEKVYVDFQRYLLTSIYNIVPSIKYGVKVRKVNDEIQMTYANEDVQNNPHIDNKVLSRDETTRIWGFDSSNNLDVIVKEDGKPVVKTVRFKDINNPTDEEMELYEMLSPAQKVYFIQQNFNNAEIFDYIQANLYNPEARGRWAGVQTLEFNDESVNPNEMYMMFKRAFESDNPMIVSAAIDLIKYAVQVEGFRMSAKAINKFIDNDALINDFNNNGIGFVSEIRKQMRNFGLTSGFCGLSTDILNTYQNYLRTLPANIPIRNITLTETNVKRFNISRPKFGILVLNQSNASENPVKNRNAFNKMLVSAGIKFNTISDEEYGVNQYIQITELNSKPVVYKIHDLGSRIVLTPLSRLESNENAQWSSKHSNNEGYLSPEAYDKLVNEFRLELKENFDNEFINKTVERLKNGVENARDVLWLKDKTKVKRPANLEFELDRMAQDGDGKAEKLKSDIVNHFTNSSEPLFVSNLLIPENIYTPGVQYGTSQKITFPNDVVREFVIYIPEKMNNIEKLYLTNAKGDKKLDTSTIPSSSLRTIVENANEINAKKLSNVALVTEVDSSYAATIEDSYDEIEDESYAATIEDKVTDIIDFNINLNNKHLPGSRLFDITNKFKNNLFANDITADVEAVKNNKVAAMRETSSFIVRTANYIRQELFDKFIEDPDNPEAYIHITDPRVQDIIADNAYYMDKYLSAILLAKEVLDRSIPLTHEQSDDKQIQFYINDIKNALIKNLEDIPFDKLNHDVGNTILKSKSTDPLVRENFLDVMDGYWKTYGSMWQFFSVMENGTPILQTILSDVMSDLDAKEKAKHKVLKEFRKRINNIIKQAELRGETIDLRKIINDDGFLYSLYTPEFLNKFNELQNEVNKYPLGSIKHLEAKLEFDKFKLKHINQDAEDSYYEEKIKIEEDLLKNIPELYSEYMKLIYRRNAIYDYGEKEDLTEELQKELDFIQLKIKGLYDPDVYITEDDRLEYRPIIDPNRTYTPEQLLDIKLHSKQSANYLADAVERLGEIREIVFEDEIDEAKGFERTLNANLNTISRLERRVNGVPTVPQSVLMENPEYVKALDWIKRNAYFKLTVEFDENKQPVSLGARIVKALKFFGRKINGERRTGGSPDFMDKARDARGVVDGRKLTDFERRTLRSNDEYFAHNSVGRQTSDPQATEVDRALINSAKPKNVVFNAAFYRQLSTGASKNINYYEVVTELNNLLAPYLGAIDGYIHFERIPNTEEGVAILNRAAELYQILAENKPTDVATDEDNSRVSDFIKNNVEFVTNEEEFKRQVKDFKDKLDNIKDASLKAKFEKAILGVLYVKNYRGEYPKDGNGDFIPNRFLYSYAKPKGQPGDPYYDRYVSKEEQEYRELLDTYYETETTEYYDYAKEEAITNGTFDEWYKENHYYNGFKRKMEPISCWTTRRLKTELISSNELQGKWVPKRSQTIKRAKTGKIKVMVNGVEETIFDPKEKHNNDNYKPNEGHLANYKVGSGYDNDVQLNQGEREMLQFLKETLEATARTNSARRYFAQGKVPMEAKSNLSIGRQIIKEIGKSVGIGLTSNTGYSRFRQEIGYGVDEAPTMPMLSELNNKVTSELNKKLKDLQANTPVKEETETDDEFADRVDKHNQAIEELKEQIRKERRAITNHNWYDVIESYLSRAADYNAVLENKNKLYYLLNMLKDMKMYSRKHGSYGDLKTQRVRDDGTVIYETSTDKNLIEDYENFLRRLFFDEWKEEDGKLTTIGNFLQGFTSANYMMMNVRGGVANVTLGATGILAEAAARDYIGGKDWAFGNTEYMKGIMGYGAAAYTRALTGQHRNYNKQEAVINYFKVVDHDETTGVIRGTGMSHYAEEIRDFFFSPQTMGEHYMQNSVLFAVLHSHKLFDTAQGIQAMNKNQFIAYRQYELLEEILDEDQLQAFEEFKEKLKKNKDELAKYAWRRREPLSRFMYTHCTDEQIDEFIKKRKEQEKRLEEEFDSKQNIYEQLELTSDGELGFVANSELDLLSRQKANTLGNVTEAESILAKLSEKTRHINNKIHGIYNRREAAYIERKWYGGVVMQYHKHIPMGLLKRYMARGHWNEFRHSVDKGMIWSVVDFLSLNLEKVAKDCNFTLEEENALKCFMFQFTHCFKLLNQMATTIKIVPEYERANMLRNLGDLVGTVSAIATTAALWAIADDDDPEGFWFNFFLYESDRLSSESFMYNPYGMFNEGKKLMSTPVAAGSVIEDALNALTGVARWAIDDEYEPYYDTGRFAGESKLSVYLQRRIPIWNGIRGLVDIEENNHYYKIGDNAVSMINIKEMVRE